MSERKNLRKMRQWFMNTKKGKWHLTLWCRVQVLLAERKQVLS